MAAQHGQFFFDTIDPANAATGYEWGCPNRLLTGTSTSLVLPSDSPQIDTGAAGLWSCTQPANAAVDPLVTIPGYGQGTGQPINTGPMPEFECSTIDHILCAQTCETREHSLLPVDENGDPIDVAGLALMFIIEGQDETDIETGSAFQDPTDQTITFTATDAHLEPGRYPFAIRTAFQKRVVAKGYIEVEYAAAVGGPSMSSDFSVCISVTSSGQALEGAIVIATNIATNNRFTADADSEGIAGFNLPVGTYDFQAFIENFKFGDPVRREVVA